MKIIRTEDLSKSFGPILAVNKLNLEVEEGEIFGLVGPDGAGKSTTIRLLTTIMKPTSGHAFIDDKDTVHEAEQIQEEIGYMSQKFGLYQELTVMENILFYADIYGLSPTEKEKKINQLLEFSQLIPFKKRLAGHLSGGMKQKLGLACALVHTPKVLFLDEPTNGVDPLSRHEFWRIIQQLLKDKVTIFISTAYMDEAERCTHVGFIHQGSLLTSGTPKEIKESLPGKILQIIPDNPRIATLLLKQTFGEDKITLFGNRIHLFTENLSESEALVIKLLPEVQRESDRMHSINPSLEDAFILKMAIS